VSITIRSRGNLTASYQYTVAGQQPEDGLRHAPPPRRRTAGAGLAGRMRRTPARPAGWPWPSPHVSRQASAIRCCRAAASPVRARFTRPRQMARSGQAYSLSRRSASTRVPGA